MSTMLAAILRAMERGLLFAGEHLLQGETPIDAEAESYIDLPDDYRTTLVNSLLGDRGFTQQEIEEHPGLDPIPADRSTHVFIMNLLQRDFPGCYVVGEEATFDEWNMTQDAPIGSLIFVVDAIDGSLNFDSLTFGYGTTFIAVRRGETSDTLLCALVANSSGFFLAFEAPGDVLAGTFTSYKSITQPFTTDFRADTVAVYASEAKHKVLARELLLDDSFSVFTTGGAPASLGMVIGRLGALACLKPSSMHDTAYLPALAFLGITILTNTGQPLFLNDVLNLFGRVARTDRDRRARPVPSLVAARNPATARELVNLLFPTTDK